MRQKFEAVPNEIEIAPEPVKHTVEIYMLLASLEVCIAKNCDRGLENAPRGRKSMGGKLGQ